MPFDVGCARCGHNLRGRVDPICPACGLTFDWADAVPIERLTCDHCDYHLYGLRETRCPECGNEFSWEGVLASYARRQHPLFEFWWRQHPIRSFVYTWWLALQPWKFWRTLEIHDRPAVRGLLVQVVVLVLFMAGSYAALAVLFGWVIHVIERGAGLIPGFGVPMGTKLGRWWPPGRFYWGPWGSRSLLPNWYRDVLPLFMLWAMVSYGALLLLRQSMKRCRVKNAHVFRVCCYSILPFALVSVVYCIAALLLDALATWFPGLFEPYTISGTLTLNGVVMMLWLSSTVSIALGYRLYLRMKHAWWVAFMTQAVAVLFVLCATIVKR